MATDHNFKVKNGLDVLGGTASISGGHLTLTSNSYGVNTRSVLARDVNGLNLGTSNGTTALSIDNSGNISMPYNLTVTGNLTVNGTTLTVDTTNLQVQDNNITLNYSTGDSSSAANGAGITIQDAVNSTTDATILWSQAGGNFNVSHGWNTLGYLQHSGYLYSRDNLAVLNSAGNGWNTWATRSNGNFNLSVGTISSGAITSSGSITATKLIDADNSNAVLDPNGASVLEGSLLSKGHSSGDNWMPYTDGNFYIRAPITIFDSNVRFADGSGVLEISGDSSSNHYLEGDGQIRIRPNGTTINKIVLDSSYLNAPAYQVGGTTVIDSSRNLTNIGTISSGSLTIDPSGTYGTGITINAGDSNTASGNAKQLVLSFGGSSSIDYAHSIRTRHDSGAAATNTIEFWLWNYGTDSSSTVGTLRSTVINPSGVDVKSGGYLVGGTTVIDSSRNLSNIGTISSGAISVTGNSTITGSGSSSNALNVYRGSDSTSALRVLNTGEVLVSSNYFYVDAAQGAYFNGEVRVRGGISNDSSSSFGGEVRILDDTNIVGALKINGTEAIDSSRNLNNISTISSSYLNTTSGGVVSISTDGSSYKSGMSRGALEIGSTARNYRYTSGWSGSMQSGILANTSEDWEFMVHDAGDALGSIFVYESANNAAGLIRFGRNAGYGVSNAVFEGTLSSGAITSTGLSSFANFRLTDSSKMGFGTVKAGATIGHTASVDEGIFWHTTRTYGIYRTSGAWSSPDFQQLRLEWETGIELDGGSAYGKSGVTVTESDFLISNNASDPTLKFVTTSSSADPVLQMNGQAGIASEGFEIWYDNSVGDVHLHTTYNDPAAAIRFHTRTAGSKATSNERFTITGDGDIQVGGTTVIDSGRVLQNTTLGHSNTGARFETNDWMYDTGGKARLYFAGGGVTYFGSDNGYVYRDSSDVGRATISNYGGANLLSGGDGQVNSNVALAVGGITVIDSSRNLNNIPNMVYYQQYTVDMTNTSTYAENTYYPVTISSAGNGRLTRMRIEVALDSGSTPSWSTHSNGFSLLLDWHTSGNGWGTVYTSRRIMEWTERWTSQTIVGGIEQMINSSTEVVYLRGGGKYFFYSDKQGISITPRSSTYTDNSQSVSPSTSIINDVWSSAANSVGLSRIYAENVIVNSYDSIDTDGTMVAPSFRVGTNDRWKIRPNSGNAQLAFEYSTSTGLSDANIKLELTSTQARLNGDLYFTKSSDPRIYAGTNVGLNIDGQALYLNRNTNSNILVGSGSAPATLSGINVHMNGSSYVLASDGTRSAFMGADSSGYAMFGSLTNHDAVIRTNNTERVRVATNGNVTFKGDTFTFHGSGTDTYTSTALYINQTYGVLLEGSLQSNASGGVKNPLVFTWRGNWNTQGGVKVEAGKTTVDSLCIKSGNNSTTVIDASRNLTNINLVKFREHTASFYISPTNPNTLNAQYDVSADTADMWINYRGYQDGHTQFRDFRIGDGKGNQLFFVDGSERTFTFGGSAISTPKVAIGNVTPSKNLHIYTADNEGIFLQGTASGVWMDVQSSGSELWSMGCDSSGWAIYNRTDSAYYLRVGNTGGVNIYSGYLQVTNPSVSFDAIDIGSGTQSGYVNIIYRTNSGNAQIWKQGSSTDSWGSSSALNIYNSNGRIAFHPQGTANVLQIDSGGPNISGSATLRHGGNTIIDSSRNLRNVTAHATDAEYGQSMVGNFGQWLAHSRYASSPGLNADVDYWGWNFCQTNTNAPHTNSSQWYRNRVSLGNAYGHGSASGDYWLEMAYPRYNLPGGGHLYIRACESGTIGNWYEVGSVIRGNQSVAGSITAQGNITAYSDERLKSNIQPLDGSKVLQMRGVSFTKNEETGSGVIAQELEKVAPELVHDNEDGYKSVAYGNLTGYLIEAIKEQQEKIEKLEELVQKLISEK